MPFVRDYLFGAPPDQATIDFFEKLHIWSKGDNQVSYLSPDVLASIDAAQKTKYGSEKHAAYLGNSIPFARMWCAILIDDLKEKEIKYFVVNDNLVPFYTTPKESAKKIKSSVPNITGQRIKQLTPNPKQNPAAGITAISTKTEGAGGAVKYCTVEFSIHNFQDYQTIFLPYFLKPGARIIVDFGWTFEEDSEDDLYKIEDIIKNSDENMSKFYDTVYGRFGHGGWINQPTRNGMVDTLFGEVVDYNVNQTQDGIWECSLQLMSSNTPLLETEISADNSLKFLFSDYIDTAIIAGTMNQTEIQYKALKKKLNMLSETKRRQLKNEFFKAAYSDASEYAGILHSLGRMTSTQLARGLYYEDPGELSNDEEVLYINYGLFEDAFLNQVLSITKEDPTQYGQFDISFNNIDSGVRFSYYLFKRQLTPITVRDTQLPLFLYPCVDGKSVTWQGSYNSDSMQKAYTGITQEWLNDLIGSDKSRYSTELVDWMGPIPFVIKEQGDYFRQWINDNYPDEAKMIDVEDPPYDENDPDAVGNWMLVDGTWFKPHKYGPLARTGNHRNKYITWAWLYLPVNNTYWKLDDGSWTYTYMSEVFVKDTQYGKAVIIHDGVQISGPQPKPNKSNKQIKEDLLRRIYGNDDYDDYVYPAKPDSYLQDVEMVPLREMFISVPLIMEAFSKENNINDALVYIWDSINEDSYNVFNIQMVSNNDAHTNIAFHDFNITIPEVKDKLIEFDVLGEHSIVSNINLRYEMPKSGLGSLMMIESLSGKNLYNVNSLDRLNLLKLLEVDRGPEVSISSLPKKNQGISSHAGVINNVTIDYSGFSEAFRGTAFNPGDTDVSAYKTLAKKLAAKVADISESIDNKSKVNNVSKDIKYKLQETRDRGSVAHSQRDFFGKKARILHGIMGGKNTIASLMEYKLDITVFGNTFLKVGTHITINGLPDIYRDRCYFQVMNIDHNITSEGWTTTYHAQMRMDPESKSLLGVDAHGDPGMDASMLDLVTLGGDIIVEVLTIANDGNPTTKPYDREGLGTTQTFDAKKFAQKTVDLNGTCTAATYMGTVYLNKTLVEGKPVAKRVFWNYNIITIPHQIDEDIETAEYIKESAGKTGSELMHGFINETWFTNQVRTSNKYVTGELVSHDVLHHPKGFKEIAYAYAFTEAMLEMTGVSPGEPGTLQNLAQGVVDNIAQLRGDDKDSILTYLPAGIVGAEMSELPTEKGTRVPGDWVVKRKSASYWMEGLFAFQHKWEDSWSGDVSDWSPWRDKGIATYYEYQRISMDGVKKDMISKRVNPSLVGSIYQHLQYLIDDKQDQHDITMLKYRPQDAKYKIAFAPVIHEMGKRIIEILKHDPYWRSNPEAWFSLNQGNPTVSWGAFGTTFVLDPDDRFIHSLFGDAWAPIIPPCMKWFSHPAVNLMDHEEFQYKLRVWNQKQTGKESILAFYDDGNQVNYHGFIMSQFLFDYVKNIKPNVPQNESIGRRYDSSATKADPWYDMGEGKFSDKPLKNLNTYEEFLDHFLSLMDRNYWMLRDWYDHARGYTFSGIPSSVSDIWSDDYID